MGWWPWSRRRNAAEAEHLARGKWGEEKAAHMLRSKGYSILGARVRIGRRDELDLVARQDRVLVFVEVKTRASEDFGRPVSAVNRAKRRALSRAAIRYMMKLKERPEYFRFDVVEVIGKPDGDEPMIRHIENAFAMDRRYRQPW